MRTDPFSVPTNFRGELVVDNFAGGGGASTGIEQALGRPIDIAVNHNREAISMHRINHPGTRHYCEDVWAIDPAQVTAGRPVGLGWFSPDCTFHSKARGAAPFRDRDTARRRRGLAWLINRWAKTSAAPRVVMLENVEEFADWGPLLPDGKVCPIRRGETFRRWHKSLENLGYRIDMREMRACDFGAPTTRKRLFIIMRRDGGEIVFPDATHGPLTAQPHHTAAECIDWSLPCPSIFERTRPLADNTLRRIARGVMRYVVDDPKPFIVRIGQTGGGGAYSNSIDSPLTTITTKAEHLLVAPTLINTRNGEREGQAPRVHDIRQPWGTVTAQGSQGAIVAAFLAKHYGGVVGHELTRPIGSITTVDHHSLVTAFLLKFYGNERDGLSLDGPLHTITTKDRFGLVMVHGEPHYIADIGMRMLQPHELYAAQGFPSSYVIDRGQREDGSTFPLTKRAQTCMVGNSVSPVMSRALVAANAATPEMLARAA